MFHRHQPPHPSHLEDENEEHAADEHDGEAVNEPGQPVDTVAETHDLHDLLEPSLFLVDDALDDHGDGEDPGDDHEEGEHAG